MKRTKTVIILITIVVVFVVALGYLWQKNQEDPIKYTTDGPSNETIVVNTVATGSIVPEEEVLIKPNISGVIEAVYIEAGEYVQAGDLIAKIRVIPNVSSLASAQNSIALNETALQNCRNQLQDPKGDL